ncbi:MULTISPECIES: GGDEF domain-containing protein [unclassified Herbaspirillum]|uniref:GGDEF domain-containing protein n=1 Tax=unclassified Herbaspirillum TaxID=2624150 RepID=UPI00116E2747|nr:MULTISPECIES: GGDEF domain-containing protein [unclassified Herbaspirillum]MBB5391823.1 diguanylate cyclase (GGDEF)-like protein [Herbaspirillum sp. SJZ102]TQK02933.1 diguanylate cyclase (GGDEF)-like protein [Herbaspirillum sp. SJZ130]TQK06679.1 diguanylate cyclase (GGDEF)-like protein [Herbaspirillum sp. SJZ106]TWC71196.1 diguanylate cyclase (GGDEF)-like protein [Herbaspirillum sp. SJZ099]
MQDIDNEMKKPLLKHLVEITAHREHSRLALSVISALYQLTNVQEIRMLDIFNMRDTHYVQEKMVIRDGEVHTIDEHTSDDPKEPLSSYPAMVACIRSHLNEYLETAEDGTHILWLPVWLHGKMNSCVEIRSTKPFDAQMLDVIHGIFHVYCNYQSLLDYSERDALTGLFNRKTFDEQFTKYAFAIAPHEAHSLEKNDRRHDGLAEAKGHWLAVVDIDHFKQVNDRYGHLYGDEVLILMANILRASFRSHDRIFRFGGEEFVILLRSTTLSDARKIFDRFRQNVQEYDFPQVGKVTVSLGFVGISRETPVVILGHADQSLYHAKKNGRNRICFYEELVDSGVLHSGITTNDTVEFF